jgi:hypothetical protein
MKTLQAREKEEVSLQERKKHANSKAKKLKKSLQDVRVIFHFRSVTKQTLIHCRMRMPSLRRNTLV